MRIVKALSAAAVLVAGASAAQAGFTVTYEAPEIVNCTAGFDYFGIETFNGKTGQSDFTSTFNHDGNTIELKYSGVQVIPFNQYGGAEQTDYAVAGLQGNSSYTIEITQGGSGGVNYFGYWLSALDGGNTVTFYSGATEVFTYSPGNVQTLLAGQDGYWGNPYTGEVGHELFVFLNFFYEDGTFDRIVFSQSNTAGYESDNHTVGFYNRQSGTPVPEPAMIGLLGLGLAGLGMARRRKAA